MKKLLIPFAFLLLIFGISCEKEKPNVPDALEPSMPFWKKVQGTYNVTDLKTNEKFTINIEITTDTTCSNETQCSINDTILYSNFNNTFTKINVKYQTGFSPSGLPGMDISGNHGIIDINNNRWLIYTLDDTTTVEEENTWVNGVITFYFRMNNMAYWQADGTFYQDLYKKQRAVKISD